MLTYVKGSPYCDYCQGRHPWPRHCRHCGAEMKDRRTLYCGGFESPCGREWAFTHATWGVVREILLKERGASCEVCGKECQAYGKPGSPETAEIHHLEEVNGIRGPGLMNRRENLLVLCHDCHQLFTNPPRSKLFWYMGRAYPWDHRKNVPRKPKAPKIPVEQLALL